MNSSRHDDFPHIHDDFPQSNTINILRKLEILETEKWTWFKINAHGSQNFVSCARLRYIEIFIFILHLSFPLYFPISSSWKQKPKQNNKNCLRCGFQFFDRKNKTLASRFSMWSFRSNEGDKSRNFCSTSGTNSISIAFIFGALILFLFCSALVHIFYVYKLKSLTPLIFILLLYGNFIPIIKSTFQL